MYNSAMLRPGVALGRYPQREDVRDTALDRFAANAVGAVRQRLRGLGSSNWKFVKTVNALATKHTAYTEFELRQHIRRLRERLYGEGLTDELVIEAFALVREVATRKVHLRHYDVQLYGGRIMLNAMVAEMETGEGKTLTATLPACTAALAGIPVHVVTVNDFLVKRDAEWMGPIYKALGLTVGSITEGMDFMARQKAYSCDVTYCTNKQLVFDYLKDRLLMDQVKHRLHLQLESLHSDHPRTSRLMLRGLCFAIVDEVDSVLVDEARTPLIISDRGDNTQEEDTYRQALYIARKLQSPRDFGISARDKRIDLTDFGRAQIGHSARSFGGIWTGTKRREGLVKQALAAHHLYHRDRQYLLKEGKVQIIDEFTGRVMADRSWERGLHQMIETKEGYALSGRHETLARISYQRFFRRYLRLAGMTGTATEVGKELWAVYGLNVVTVPTNVPLRRRKMPDRVFQKAEAKWTHVARRVLEMHREGRPTLIGTRSVEASEHLSHLLRGAILQHQVLNARQDQEEAKIISQAGHQATVTVATNMAGRGTDIKLAQGVNELGGLHVLASERHEARRIDRQLFGRGGRQGDRGSFEAILSLEDELLTDFYGDRLQRIAGRLFDIDSALPRWFSTPLVWLAQRAAERHNSQMRQDLLKHDDRLGDLLAFSGETL
ncbi:MAG: preprotein translocase subunit SecA [Gammaproteobacteria bacterium]|nr:preprotein translocase subunit SecA [Gammaproteobacteria bacterium]